MSGDSKTAWASQAARFVQETTALMGILDASGAVVAVNPALTDLLGYPEEDILGQPYAAFVAQADQEEVAEAAEALARGENVRNFECRFIREDGSTVPLRWSIVAERSTGRFFGVAQEIQEEIAVRGRLRKRRAFFASVVEGMAEGLLILNGEGLVLEVNPAGLEILGRTVEGVVGARGAEFFEGTLDSGKDVVLGKEAGGPSASYSGKEISVRRPDGTLVPTLVHIRHSQVEEPVTIVVFQDMTRSKKMEARLRREIRLVEAADLQRRTAGELHDGILQTLTAVGIRLDVAEMQLATDPDAARTTLAELAATVRGEQQELRLFVDELKLQDPYWVDRSVALTQRVQGMLDRICSIWTLRSELKVEDAGEQLSADLERGVFRIIQEGVVNAARHGRAGHVVVAVRISSDMVGLEISDDGKGFSFHGDYEHEELVGSRLGPVSLKRRVIECGGRLSIRSSAAGVRMSVTIPLVNPEAP